MASASFTSSFFNSPLSERQKVLYALAASVALHLLIFIAITLWLLLHRDTDTLKDLKVVEVAVATPTPVPIEMFPPLPAPASTPIPVDSRGLKKTDQAPVNPVFQSDVSSVAGSMYPANGRIPLPSQLGKNRRELAFETREFTPGTTDGGAVAAPPVMEFAPAPDLPRPPKPVSTPVPQPKPTPQVTPTPEPRPSATPEPMVSATPAPTMGEEPLYKPTPVPTPTPQATPDLARPTPVATPKPVASMAMLSTPRPKVNPSEQTRPEAPGYHPEMEQNKIEGGISNRGPAGVDAIGTPLGLYRKRIGDAIGSRWHLYVKQNTMGLINSGSVRIKFFINQMGRVEDLKVIEKEAGEGLTNISVQSIWEAKFPPPPSEIAPSLENGRYEVTFTFTIYPD